jgi:hypothetical protein
MLRHAMRALARSMAVCVVFGLTWNAVAYASDISFPQAPMVSPTAADAYYPTRVVSAVAPPSATNSDAEIADTARALSNNPDLIVSTRRGPSC